MSANTSYALDGVIGLFFVVNGKLLLHTCHLDDGEPYGDFINYPESHDAIWQRKYAHSYGVDFDYFPRGRIIYNRIENVYLLYHDPCVASEAEYLHGRYLQGICIIELDEHYQCHKCNKHYVI